MAASDQEIQTFIDPGSLIKPLEEATP